MQSFRMACAIVAGATFVAGAALAQAPAVNSKATLSAPVSAPRSETISGVAWHCDGDACVGQASHKPNLDNPVRECKKVVAVVGPVASYRTATRQLDDGELKACNRGAPAVQTAAN